MSCLAPRLGIASVVLALAACSDHGLSGWEITQVAVTAGDFDDVSQPLNRMSVAHATYEGIISTATWDPDYDHENVALKVETLLGDRGELLRFGDGGAVFLASGTRGFGLREYNGLDPDDHLVTSEVVLENVEEFVDEGGTLVVTDWTYDVIQAVWPEAVTFLDQADGLDAAQKGEVGRITARVEDADLRDALEMDQVSLYFNYSNWAVAVDTAPDTVVYLRGDASYRPDGITSAPLEDVPLMVGFRPEGARGKVVFLSFHTDAQTPEVMDRIVRTAVGSFAISSPPSVP